MTQDDSQFLIESREPDAACPRIGHHLSVVASQGDPDYAAYAAAIITNWQALSLNIPGGIFNDSALIMMLDLFLAAERNEKRYVTSGSRAATLPHTTILRYIDLMSRAGLITRPPDARGTLIAIAPKTREDIRAWLEATSSIRLRRQPRELQVEATSKPDAHRSPRDLGRDRRES
ncbi:hypothetical protein [Sphingomonas sp.]|uniref:hypothetical protein n=1 Tax=Sphingomonas sp. TaxID=28214 RepID=UPI003B009E1D